MTPPKPSTKLARAPQNAPMMPPGAIDGEFDGGGLSEFNPTPTEAIAGWVEKVLAKPHKVTFLLKQRSMNIDSATVHEWTPEDTMGMGPEDLAEEIYQAAHEDANMPGVTGPSNFAIWACKGDVESAPFMRTVFQIIPDDLQQGFTSEPGNIPEGHMAQAHRHVEIMMRMHVGMVADTFRHMREENKDLRVQATRAADFQLKTMELHQKLMDRQMLRDIAARKAMRAERMKDQMIGMVMQFMPDVAMRLGIVPGAVGVNFDDLNEMMASIPDDKFELMITMIEKPKQREAITRFRNGARMRLDAKVKAKQLTDQREAANGNKAPQEATREPQEPTRAPPPAAKPTPQLTVPESIFHNIIDATKFIAHTFAKNGPLYEMAKGLMNETQRKLLTPAVTVYKLIISEGQQRDLTEDERGLMLAASNTVYDVLVEAPEPAFAMLLGQIPDENGIHESFKDLRKILIELKQGQGG